MNNANISNCAVCREPLGNKRIRALSVEQLIEAVDLELACKHPDCVFKAPKRDLLTHEMKCKYRIVPCPDKHCLYDSAARKYFNTVLLPRSAILQSSWNG